MTTSEKDELMGKALLRYFKSIDYCENLRDAVKQPDRFNSYVAKCDAVIVLKNPNGLIKAFYSIDGRLVQIK